MEEEGKKKGNSHKSVRWSAVPIAPRCQCMRMCDGKRGSSPEGADDLCFVS